MKNIKVIKNTNKIINIFYYYFSFCCFLTTPIVTPLLPVLLVCCPLTLSNQWCLSPLCLLVFFILSRSSLILVSKTLVEAWMSTPSLKSLLLLKNQTGMLYFSGSTMILEINSQVSLLRVPALMLTSMLATLQMAWENLLPIPLMAVRALVMTLFPMMLVFCTLMMCWNSFGFSHTKL